MHTVCSQVNIAVYETSHLVFFQFSGVKDIGKIGTGQGYVLTGSVRFVGGG